MAKIVVRRTNAPAGNQEVGAHQYDNELDGQTGVVHLGYIQSGSPVRLRKIAHLVSSVATDGSIFPDSGTGVVVTGGSTSIVGASIPSNIDYPGLCVAITSGTGVGQARRIQSVSGQTITPDRPFSPAVGAGAGYMFFVECEDFGQVFYKFEYSPAFESNFASVSIGLLDFPVLGTRGPHIFFAEQQSPPNLLHASRVSQASQFHGQGIATACRGWLGSVLLISSLQPGTTVSAWACAS